MYQKDFVSRINYQKYYTICEVTKSSIIRGLCPFNILIKILKLRQGEANGNKKKRISF